MIVTETVLFVKCIIALFIFIEWKRRRAAALQSEIEALRNKRKLPSWIRIMVISGEFVGTVTETLDQLRKDYGDFAPTLAFIDPLGFKGMPLDAIVRIVKHPKCECLITFMYEFINRFLNHKPIEAHLSNLFGTDEWRQIIASTDANERRYALVDLYRRQLKLEAGLKYVRSFQMINVGNRTEYFLFFGTNSEKGLSKMKQVMWKADPIGGQAFSDRTNPLQQTLIEPGPNLHALRQVLVGRFREREWVSINEIERFVLEDAAYSEAIHLKRMTLMPMETSEPPMLAVSRPPGRENRRGTYPPGTTIRFS
jgi:three-Cys-motif partner protein